MCRDCVLEVTLGSLLLLDREELGALVAHELGHARHDRPFRLLYFASAFCVAGIAYLNFLVDYTQREFAADEFAVRLGCGDGLRRLVRKTGETGRRPHNQEHLGSGDGRDWRRYLREVVWPDVKDAYFRNHVPWYFHPTTRDRLANIEHVVSLMNG